VNLAVLFDNRNVPEFPTRKLLLKSNGILGRAAFPQTLSPFKMDHLMRVSKPRLVRNFRNVVGFSMLLLLAAVALAQSKTTSTPQGSVPRLIKFSGSLRDAQGHPRTGVVGVMFSIYPEQLGSAALWSETQNVSLDSEGRYSVLLGSEHSEGLSMDLFASGEGRWLGVQMMAQGEPEQSRVLLVSVPYAMKAGDAATLGGLPATAFLLAQADSSISSGTKSNTSSRAVRELSSPTLGSPATAMTTGGTAGQLSKFQDASTLVDTIISEFVNAGAPTNASKTHIGIGIPNPTARFSVVHDSAADPTSTATVDIINTHGSSNGGATLNVNSSGGSDPLIQAVKSFQGDSSQFGNLLSFIGTVNFLENGSLGAQSLSVTTDVPASNTFNVVGILGSNYLTTNEGTGNVGVITGFESDAVSSAGTSTKVEGMEVSATNDGGTIGQLIGGASKVWSTQALGATPGTTTDGIGWVIRSPEIDAGTITNVYGLQIEDQVGGLTNNFAITTGLGPVKFGDKTMLAASTASAASLNIPAGTAPGAPASGDIWNDGTNLLIRAGGTTKTLAFTDSALTGNGSGLTSLSAANIAAGTAAINVSGNAGTATALSANGSNCSAGWYAAGVDAAGNAEGCSTSGSSFTALNATQLTSGIVPDARISGTYTSAIALGNAGNTFIGTTASMGLGIAGAAVTGLNIANTVGATGVQGTTQSNSASSYGVAGLATQPAGIGGSFRNSAGDANIALEVRNAAGDTTNFSVAGNGTISGIGTQISNLNAGNLFGTISGNRLVGVTVTRSSASGLVFGATNTINAANQHGFVGTTQSNTGQSYGVFGVATQPNGIGGAFKNSAGDTNTALAVRNAADSATNFSVTGAGAVTIGSGGAAIKTHLSAVGSVAYAGATLANQNCIDSTFTVTGAVDSDTVNFGVPASLGDLGTLQWSGYVSATDTVLFRICNNGSSPILMPASTVSIRADVWHH
jgi:hypothetical protein